MSIKEIESVVAQLPPDDLAEFARWFEEFHADALKVLADLTPIERAVQTTEGRWFLMRLRPYRTLDDKIDGIVATFVDVTERREAEAAWEARQTLLIDEVNNRVDTTLSVAKSIMQRSLEGGDVSQELQELLNARIEALARAHAVVAQNEWRATDLESIARRQLEPYGLDIRLLISGPTAMLSPALAMPLSVALYELATNSTKDGSLSAPDGRVRLTWRVEQSPQGARLTLTWTESGGPPPSRAESGDASLALIERAIPAAEVERRHESTGLVCTIAFALPEPTTRGDGSRQASRAT